MNNRSQTSTYGTSKPEIPRRELVSVVVPVFNQGRYLPMALDSVMFQDYPEVEIIVCNHGSTDGTSEIIRDYLAGIDNDKVSYLRAMEARDGQEVLVRQEERRYPGNRRICVVESLENIGGTRSYNEGFRRAQGKYATYLVGDDYFLPHALSELVTMLESSQADVAYADLFVVDDSGRILQELKKPPYSFKVCFADWFHLGVARLHRRSLHEEVGYFDPAYRNANDYDLYLRFAMAGASFVHLPRTVYCTRKHDPDNPDEPASWRNNGYANLMRESIQCAERAREFSASRLSMKNEETCESR